MTTPVCPNNTQYMPSTKEAWKVFYGFSRKATQKTENVKEICVDTKPITNHDYYGSAFTLLLFTAKSITSLLADGRSTLKSLARSLGSNACRESIGALDEQRQVSCAHLDGAKRFCAMKGGRLPTEGEVSNLVQSGKIPFIVAPWYKETSVKHVWLTTSGYAMFKPEEHSKDFHAFKGIETAFPSSSFFCVYDPKQSK